MRPAISDAQILRLQILRPLFQRERAATSLSYFLHAGVRAVSVDVLSHARRSGQLYPCLQPIISAPAANYIRTCRQLYPSDFCTFALLQT